ncbi:MAG TPA: amidase family protein, partial [Candidatus Limnocylindrales bacterium]|nr:amidase family protein [Candidatus Limnocylindrales bacterium]
GSSRSPRRILATPRLGGDEPIDPDVAAAFEAALGAIEADLGLPVERIAGSTVFPAGYRSRDWFEIAGVEQAHRLGRERIERDADRLDPTFRRWMEAALGVSIADHLAARRRRFVHVRELDTLLGDETLLVCPTVTVPGWTPDGRLPGAERPGLPSAVFNTEVVNLTGHPALSLPAGRLPNGLPFGLQAVGPRYREALLFGFAEAWERARPWPLVADGYAVFGAELGRV